MFMNWKIDKGIWKGCILSPGLFNLHAEFIMQNARLDRSEAGIKTTRTNSIDKGFPRGSVVKNLPAMQEIQVWSLGREDPLEEEMATHSSILARRISWTEEAGRLQYMGSQESDMT